MAPLSVIFIALSVIVSSQAFNIPRDGHDDKKINILDDGILFTGPKQQDILTAITIGGTVVPVVLDIEE